MAETIYFNICDTPLSLDTRGLTPGQPVVSMCLSPQTSSPEASRQDHDLRSAVASLRMNLQIQEQDLTNPTPRDHKKFLQLNAHLDRLAEAAEHICKILEAGSAKQKKTNDE